LEWIEFRSVPYFPPHESVTRFQLSFIWSWTMYTDRFPPTLYARAFI
jgi:hypothetical protein